MSFGLHELLGSCLALLTLPVFFLAPGYLLASATGLMGFHRQSWIERSLWACALSLPISLLFTVHPGIALSPQLTTAGFLLLFAAAAALALRDLRRDEAPTCWDRHATLVFAAALALIPYVILSTVPVEIHARLYESAVWQDWNVRIQLINASIRGGNHPGNPMFAPAGQPAPLHYYYFWYVLCARMHDLVHVSARSLLTASCVGAALSLLAFLLLAIKYLSPSPMPVRRQALAALLSACILGLDILPFTAAALHHRTYTDLQFWLDDRSPGFLHMILWSPHHVAGLVCCGLGTLLFVTALDASPRHRVLHAVLAGVCFAASAGTSTFITLLFACACAALFLDAALRRQWILPRTMLLATMVAAVLIVPFLRSVLLNPGPKDRSTAQAALPANSISNVPKAPLLTVDPRYRGQALRLLRLTVSAVDRQPIPVAGPGSHRSTWTTRLFRPPFMAALFVCEFGFFLFVLAFQVRMDFFTPGPLSRRSRTLWLAAAGIALPGFLLSSSGHQGNNDFGRHAGFCLRLFLTLWSAPLIADFLTRLRDARQTHTRLPLTPAARCAVVLALLGLVGQVTQIVLVRIRFALTNAGLLPYVMVEERVAHPAFRFGQIQAALSAATLATPAEGILQGNPHSRLRNVFLLYTGRQMAASDDGCNIPFGGDPNTCLPLSQALIQLYGGMGPHYHGEPLVFYNRIPFNPAFVTPANFARVCSTYKLTTLVVTFVDPVWWNKQSWAWQLHPIFANSTARVFPCSSPHANDAQPLKISAGP